MPDVSSDSAYSLIGHRVTNRLLTRRNVIGETFAGPLAEAFIHALKYFVRFAWLDWSLDLR